MLPEEGEEKEGKRRSEAEIVEMSDMGSVLPPARRPKLLTVDENEEEGGRGEGEGEGFLLPQYGPQPSVETASGTDNGVCVRVCVYVCACVRMCVCMCACVRVPVRACVCARVFPSRARACDVGHLPMPRSSIDSTEMLVS